MLDHSTIRDLIQSNALELYGQPKWTFGKNTCNTYEVFAEKIHLPNGEILPMHPVLETIEADAELTELFSAWFMEAAMRSTVELAKKADSNVTLSMNVLPLYANHENYVEQVLTLLESTGLSTDRLQFEVSEAQGLTEQGIENLNRLHDDHDIGLLLGNFGMGHSNIALLRDVHFDGLELDRSFAAGIPDHEQTCRLIYAIFHFADTLDLYVCAKGIETQEQFEFFEDLECRKGQGFLIGKPMNLDDLRSYIQKYAVKRKHDA